MLWRGAGDPAKAQEIVLVGEACCRLVTSTGQPTDQFSFIGTIDEWPSHAENFVTGNAPESLAMNRTARMFAPGIPAR
jgi:hypothetical protein